MNVGVWITYELAGVCLTYELAGVCLTYELAAFNTETHVKHCHL